MNKSELMQGYGYDYNNPKNIGGDYKVIINNETYKTKAKILDKLTINFNDFGNPNEIEKEIIEQINTENIELYHKILGKLKFYKNRIGIILNGNEIFFEKNQKLSKDKLPYTLINKNNTQLLDENQFIELFNIFKNNTEIFKELLNINLETNYFWGKDGLIYNLSNQWNGGHIQENLESNKRIFRLGTIITN